MYISRVSLFQLITLETYKSFVCTIVIGNKFIVINFHLKLKLRLNYNNNLS